MSLFEEEGANILMFSMLRACFVVLIHVCAESRQLIPAVREIYFTMKRKKNELVVNSWTLVWEFFRKATGTVVTLPMVMV